MTLCIQASANQSGDFYYKIVNSTAQIFNYVGVKQKIEIPATIDGYKVKAVIGFTIVFQSVKEMSIPKGVDFIDISDHAGILEKINVDENNLKYSSKDGVLFNKEKTVLIRCPKGATGIYSIPSSVKTIGEYAFWDCKYLTNVKIPDSVNKIESTAFGDCSKLNKIVLPDSIKIIEDMAFAGCLSVKEIIIPNGLTTINLAVFAACKDVEKVSIPKSVTKIEDYAFRNCAKLIAVNFLGDAPIINENSFEGAAPGFKIYYHLGKNGFTNPWYGYNTVNEELTTFLPIVIGIMVVGLIVLLILRKRRNNKD